MPVKTLLDDPDFYKFYIVAKRSTYAAGGDQKAEVLRNGGKRYVFYDEERWPQWRYTDIYHGYNPFFGCELVEETEGTTASVWTPRAQMAYDGHAKGTENQVKQMFTFLEKMLQRVSVQSPFRGPNEPTLEDGLMYQCGWARLDPYRLHGKENIVYALPQEAFYELRFQFCCLR